MITAQALAKIELPHRCSQIAAAAESGAVAAAGDELAIVYVPPDATPVETRALPRSPRHIALAPAGDVLAIVDAAGISLSEPATGARIAETTGHFQGCAFSADGRWLCAAQETGDNTVTAELRDGRTLALVAACEVDDPFGGSSCMVFPHPDPSRLCLWVAAGQDGAVNVMLTYGRGKLTGARLTDLEDETPPAFSPTGDSLLVVDDAGGNLRHYAFPDGRCLGELSWKDHEDPLAEQLHFVDRTTALVSTVNRRLHLVEVPSMRIVDELAVEGHPSRPIKDLYYPALKDDTGWASDLFVFAPIRDRTFVSIHERRPSHSTRGPRDLVLWRVDPDGARSG